MAGAPEDNEIERSRLSRLLWQAAGLALVGIGFVGLFVPLMPTTVFLILALPCFARSSPALERWLLDHPRVGPSLRAWRTERAIPQHAKLAACSGMLIGFAMFCCLTRPGGRMMLAVTVILVPCAIWIIGRPVPSSST